MKSKFDYETFTGIDCGKGKVDFRQAPVPHYEMRPVEIYHKIDGSIDYAPTFTIVMFNPIQNFSVFGQVTLNMLNEGLEQIGYRLVKVTKL